MHSYQPSYFLEVWPAFPCRSLASNPWLVLSCAYSVQCTRVASRYIFSLLLFHCLAVLVFTAQPQSTLTKKAEECQGDLKSAALCRMHQRPAAKPALISCRTFSKESSPPLTPSPPPPPPTPSPLLLIIALLPTRRLPHETAGCTLPSVRCLMVALVDECRLEQDGAACSRAPAQAV